ncbi:hypothetical protein MMC19_005481 [Ptychographa xylographoides]|nr:hypothetical protein [Ptychographa xylographoides]
MANSDFTAPQQRSLLQREAIDRAHTAFSRLNKGDVIFQQCMTQEETLVEVVESVLQKCQSHRKKKSSRFLQKFQSYTLWLQNMGSVVDVAVQAQAGIGCPVWAPIKLVLKVSNDDSEAVERILNIIQKIAECLPRFEIYENLQEDPVLQVALLNVFTDVVEFSVRAAHFFQRGTIVRLARILWRTFDQELGDVVMRLERHACNVDQTAVAVELLKAAEHRKKADQERHSDLIIQCERWLKPANTKEIHECQTRARLDQTCTWITMHDAFKRWIDCQLSSLPDRFLCISGTHGCGKSVLASFIVSNLKAQQLHALFFAFSATDSTRSDAVGMVRALIWQLLQRTTDNKSLTIVCGLMSQGEPTTSELWDIFGQIAGCVAKPVYCVIDGIDESTDCDQITVGRLTNLARTYQNLHILLLGRPHATTALLQSTAHSVRSIEITNELISHDIEAFIESEITKSEVLNLPEFRGRISDTLRAKSDCMFLWVKLMVEDLRKSSTRLELFRRLQNLPCGLEDAYRLVFKRLIERLDSFDLHLVQTLLTFTVVTCRPLTIEQFRYAYALESRSRIGADGHTLEEFLLVQPIERLLSLCEGLVLITNGSIQLVHSSIKDFLTRPSERWVDIIDLVVQSFRVDISAVHQLFTSISLDYLVIEGNSLTSKEPSGIQSWEKCYSFVYYVLLYICYHFNRSGSPSAAILEKIDTLAKSTQIINWIEHYVVILFEDPSLEVQLHELELSRDTLSKTTIGQDLFYNFRGLLQSSFASRWKLHKPNDPRFQQWQLLLAAYFDDELSSEIDRLGHEQGEELIAEPAVAKEKDIASSASPEVGDLKPYSTELAQINHILSRHDVCSTGLQLEIALRLQQSLKRFHHLTDPLELLLRLILRKASSIPVYGLLAVANFYNRVSKYREAIEVCSIAIKNVKNQNTPVYFRLHDLIGDCHFGLLNYNEALASYRIAYIGFNSLFGDMKLETIHASCSVAFCLYNLEKHTEALEYFQRRLIGYETTIGPLHQTTLDTLYWIAHCFDNLEKYTEAFEYFQRCLPGYETTTRPLHQTTLNTLYWIAHCFYNLKRYTKALEYFQRCYPGYETTLGLTHEDTLDTLYWTARCFYNLKMTNEALECFQRCYTANETTFGLTHEDTLNTMHWTACCFYDLKMTNEALECFQRCYTADKTTFGLTHEDTLNTMHWTARCFHDLKMTNEALEFFQCCLASDEFLDTLGDLDQLNILGQIQQCYHRQARYQEALEFLDSLSDRMKSLGKQHLAITCGVYKGIAHHQLERFEEAIECFEAMLMEEQALPEGLQDSERVEWILRWLTYSKAYLQSNQITETEDDSWTGQAAQVCQDSEEEDCVQETL